jgi:uncharacterized protein YlxW (UPF0749 family)
MAARIAQLSLFAVALIIGVLLVGQLRSQAPAIELSSLSAQELSGLVETLSARNVQLSDGLEDLRDQIREYERAEIAGQSTLAIGMEDLLEMRAFGALLAVRGQGIRIDVEGSFDAPSVNDLIYELRGAGAEAVAVDDVRITARSVAVQGSGAIEIDGVPIGRRFEVSAIGSPDGLESALLRPGGILGFLKQYIPDANFVIHQDRSLVVPATERDLTPQAARPVE